MSSSHCHPLYSCYSSCRHCCCRGHPADQAGEDEHVDQKAQRSEPPCKNKAKHEADKFIASQKRVDTFLQALFSCRAYRIANWQIRNGWDQSITKAGKCHFVHHTGQLCRLKCVNCTNNAPRAAAHKQDKIKHYLASILAPDWRRRVPLALL